MKHLFATLLFLAAFAAQTSAAIWYVKPNGSDANTGDSWGAAFQNIQTAISAGTDGDEIWVAEGTYLPTLMWSGNTNRHKTFFVNFDVKLFGGFVGTETMRDQRDWAAHPTILSGDLGVQDNFSDNAYHVVWINGRSSAMDLDGFTITKGKCDGLNSNVNDRGAGIYNTAENYNSTPTIRNCTITGNFGGAFGYGAGMYNYGVHDASATLTDCTFFGNAETEDGGAMYNFAGAQGIASPVLTNCAFTNNSAGYGGAMVNKADYGSVCAPVLTNCTFTNNYALVNGGAMFNWDNISTPVLNNCTFSINSAGNQGGAIFHQTGIITLNNCSLNNNTSKNGGGLLVLAGGVLATDCTFSGNTATTTSGGAVDVWGFPSEAFTFLRCTFSGNSAANGGAVSLDINYTLTLEALFDRCTFSGNSATNGGALYTAGSHAASSLNLTLLNCRLFDNTASERGGAFCSGANIGSGVSKLYHCTFYNNTAALGGGAVGTSGYSPNQPTPSLHNCIAWNNSSTFGQTAGGQGGLGIQYSLIQESGCPTGATCGNGVVYNKNPFFVNAAANDFHLMACSPAVSAANGTYSPPIDFDGIARPQNGGYDMGAFEYVGAPCVLEAKCKNISVNLSAAGSVNVPASSIDDGSTGCTLQFQINNQAAQTYTCANVGSNVATLKATDCNNATSTCTATVTVVDNLPPTITCPNSQTYNTTQCTATANYTTPTYTDNCTATVTLLSGLPSGSAFPQGVTPNVWKATDAGSNSTTCAFTVTVTGGQAMTLACPANIAKNTDPNQCSAVTTYAQPTVSNPCGNVTLSLVNGFVSGSAFPKGSTTVTWKASSSSSAMATCSFIVTVTDAQMPSITCPANLVRSTDANLCSAVVTYSNATATDNCPNVTAMHLSGGTSGSIFQKGATTVQWKATDEAGLAKTCTFTITVNDTQPPAITCPANQTKSTDAGQCYAVATYTNPVATDNCPNVTKMHVSGGTSGSQFQKGATAVTWKATDAAGLTKTCTFRITVNDTELPTITCPGNQSKNTDPNQCSAVATYDTPTAADNCTPPPTVVKTNGLASGSAFPKGANTVVWKTTDGAGLTKTCSFTVTVTDVQAPTITCPANITAQAQPGQCSAAVNYATPTASDNCSVSSTLLISGLASGSMFPQGMTTNVWRAFDNSGLSSICAFTVTVTCGASPSFATATAGKGAKFEVRSSKFESGTGLSNLGNLDLRLAPNPATTQTEVSIENLGENDAELSVFDAQGRAVWQQHAVGEQMRIDLDDRWQSGVDMVVLRTGKQVVAKRLVVQH